MNKRFGFFAVLCLLGLSFGVFILVRAQTPPPAPVCGNGIVESGEDCDDGDTINGNGCNNSCLFVCGDKTVSRPNRAGVNEWCDDAGETELCTASCGAKLLGWAWSNIFGWLSLNSANCNYFREPNQPSICSSPTYYVHVLAGASGATTPLEGWAWSNNIGWVCFGESCSCASTDPGTIRNLIPGMTQPQCETAYGAVVPTTPGGWVATVAAAGSEPGQEPSVTGWAKATAYGDSGWFSLNCSDPGVCASSNYEVRLGSDWFYKADEIASSTRPTLIGFAWHNYAEGGGLGWLGFSPADSFSWLQTRLGDVYARGPIQGERPEGVFNATYRILANGDVTFGSASGVGTPWVDPSYGPIDFPTPQTRYSNLLGKVDVDGLTCAFTTQIQTSCVNRYGQTVHKITSAADLTNPLGGTIYYYPGTWNAGQNRFDPGGTLAISSLNPPITFGNASASAVAPGGGLIIVNGNLAINSDLAYQDAAALNTFKNLASVAWLVKGDITIDGSVKTAVGAFVALGNGVACPVDVGQPANSCGRFSSGSSGEFLDVSGLIMARQFNFQRVASSPLRGSELIIYDGRLLANIPPGLADFADALPIWRSATFAP